MKILLASTIVPFIKGGGRSIVFDLRAQLRARGHEVDELLLPFTRDPTKIVEQMLALRLLDVSTEGDLLIAIRTPSYILSHHNKVVWFIHHHRAAYDLWQAAWQDGPPTFEDQQTRRIIMEADDLYLREARRLFTNSVRVAQRLRQYNGLDSEVLYPPLGDVTGFRCTDYGDFIFYPSRLAKLKRQALMIESMAHVRSDVRLVIAGSPDQPSMLAHLERLIQEHGLEDRVELLGTWISEERKKKLFANALACAYIPYDEDSYGYVTLESYYSRKPVITCADSGGTLELIEDGVTGFVVDPDPVALAAAMDRLRGSVPDARRMGEAGHDRLLAMKNLSWDHVVERLLA